ncbi:hypothetical protein WICPIJ_000489, partial [Wickerhamomyces pijperi]
GYKSENDSELAGALGSMQRDYEGDEEESDEETEEDDESEEDEEDLAFSEEEDEEESDNERIIQALSEGQELKTDKFGNYILE